MVKSYGLANVACGTVTHSKVTRDARVSQRMWNSFASNCLAKDYRDWLRVLERHTSQGIHYHIMLALALDVRTGFAFDVYAAARAEWLANGHSRRWQALRREWKASRSPGLVKAYREFKEAVQRYGFGKVVDLMPVLSTEEGVAFYFGKYISKHIDSRLEADKGVRLFACSKGVRRAAGAMAWHSARSWLWRKKLGALARQLGFTTIDDFTTHFGSRWAFFLQERIMGVDLAAEPGGIVYPTVEHLRADGFPISDDMEWGEGFHVDRTSCGPAPLRLQVKRAGRPWRPRVEILGDPVWAVPDYSPPAEVDSSWVTPGILAEQAAREREMRLYASAIPPWHDAKEERRYNDN